MGHIPHLYVPGPWTDSGLKLTDSQQSHLFKVLRMVEGDPVSYTDGAGTVGRGRLERSLIERGVESRHPSPSAVTVAVAPPSSRQRCRILVQKLAEIGVRRLTWVRTRHTEGRPPSPDKTWAWIESAIEQSRGAWLTDVTASRLNDLEVARLVVAHPGGGRLDQTEIPSDPILLVGPEGGLDDDEIPARSQRISLGPTVLRVETAAVVGAFLLSAAQANERHH